MIPRLNQDLYKKVRKADWLLLHRSDKEVVIIILGLDLNFDTREMGMCDCPMGPLGEKDLPAEDRFL